MESSTKVTLKSTIDGSTAQIEKKCARHAGLIQNLIDQYPNQEVIEIPEVKKAQLLLVAEFVNHYLDTEPIKAPRPLPEFNIAKVYGNWEETFCNNNFKTKYDAWALMEAAHFVDCVSLVELLAALCAITCNEFKTHKEFLDYFDEVEDLTDEDVERLEKEHEEKKALEREERRKKAEEEDRIREEEEKKNQVEQEKDI